MTPFTRDRIMSLHRRAYACETQDAWWTLARTLDCPVEAIDQIWKTARAARAADMPPDLAFPLSGQFSHHLDLERLPGDRVWWRDADGAVAEGTLVEWVGRTAVLTTPSGRVSVPVEP